MILILKRKRDNSESSNSDDDSLSDGNISGNISGNIYLVYYFLEDEVKDNLILISSNENDSKHLKKSNTAPIRENKKGLMKSNDEKDNSIVN